MPGLLVFWTFVYLQEGVHLWNKVFIFKGKAQIGPVYHATLSESMICAKFCACEAGWVGDLEREKYVIPAVRDGGAGLYSA